MANDYPMGGESYEPPEQSAPREQSGAAEESESMGATALLPKSILGGKDFNPGDEVVLKVVRLYDDEVEVRLPDVSKPIEKTTDEEIDQMAENPPPRRMRGRGGMMGEQSMMS